MGCRTQGWTQLGPRVQEPGLSISGLHEYPFEICLKIARCSPASQPPPQGCCAGWKPGAGKRAHPPPVLPEHL